MNVVSYMFSRIDRTMLASRATEGYLQIGKATVEPSLHVEVNQRIDAIEETQYLAIILKELYHLVVTTGEMPVLRVAPRVVGATTVEDVTATIARDVFRYAFLI